jgi:hypothetical protein
MKVCGKVDIIKENDVIIGLLLPANYAAEHESGVKGILRSLNINPKGHFLEGRTMPAPMVGTYGSVQYKKTNTFFENGKKTKVSESAYALLRIDNQKNTKAELFGSRYKQDIDIVGAWDENEFCITGWTPEGKEAVKLIQEGIEQGDLAAWMGGAGPFGGGGLTLIRASMVSDEQKEIMRKSDQDAIDLIAAAEATGIEERLKSAKTARSDGSWNGMCCPGGYFALVPKMLSPESMKERNTVHPVEFFLNPMGQSKYNFGWFTVEELDAWLEEKGPIIKEETRQAEKLKDK